MSDHLDSVKDLARLLRSWAKTAGDKNDSKNEQGWLAKARNLDAATAEIEALRKKTAPLAPRLGDLSDLPEELLSELTGIDELENQIVVVINAYGGTADLDQILVGLYRKFQVIQKRRFVQQKLWRMQKDELAWAVPRRKGTYTTTKPAEPEPASAEPTAENVSPFGRRPSPMERKPAVAAPDLGRGRYNDLDDDIPF